MRYDRTAKNKGHEGAIMNVLVVAAHPDDEVLGCGGTIARFVKEGNTVYTLILGEGITSRDEKRDRYKNEEEIKKLKSHMKAASKIIGVKDAFVFDFPDNRFDSVALLDMVKTVETIKKRVNPDIIFTHHQGDLNIDHQITFRAVMTAFRPMRGEKAKEVYSFEVPSSTEWNAPIPASYFMPNYFIDVSNTLELKIKAMKEYKSEIMEYPHPRSPEAIRIYARFRGIQVGLEAAEAFEVIRMIR